MVIREERLSKEEAIKQWDPSITEGIIIGQLWMEPSNQVYHTDNESNAEPALMIVKGEKTGQIYGAYLNGQKIQFVEEP